jgi:hypothetical protein
MPDDAISELQAMLCEQGIQGNVERQNFVCCRYVIANLPANAPSIPQSLNAERNHLVLLVQIVFKAPAFLVFLSDVVWR